MGGAGHVPVGDARWSVTNRKKQPPPQRGREHLEEETNGVMLAWMEETSCRSWTSWFTANANANL